MFYQIKTETKDLFLIAIPRDIISYDLTFGGMLFFKRKNGKERFMYLPKYMYCDKKVIDKLSKLSTEVIKQYVKLFSVTRTGWFGYKDYIKSSDKEEHFTCTTISWSFFTLLESNNVDLSKEYLILEKL